MKITFRKLLGLGGMIACALVASHQAMSSEGAPLAANEIPTFKYDPEWPRVLPNKWTMGTVGAIHVTPDDHIWVAQRPSSVSAPVERYALENLGDCCAPAPPVIEFDRQGNVVKAWGLIHMTNPESKRPYTGSGNRDPYRSDSRDDLIVGTSPYPKGVWPMSEHGIFVDHNKNVWVLSQHNPSQISKFTIDGKFIKMFGGGEQEAKDNLDKDSFAGPTDIWVDPKTNEAYVSDGYRNRRVIVFDGDTGAFKRMWGANGKPPKEPQPKDAYGSDRMPDQFSITHCLEVSNDGLIYVCDRANSRIQIFKQDGTYVNQVVVGEVERPNAKNHIGTAWWVAFSPDKEQRFMYMADGANKKIWIVSRKDLKVLGNFGHGGRQGGHFETVHAIAVDSTGNIYAGETLSGNRIQRFNYVGMQTAPAQ